MGMSQEELEYVQQFERELQSERARNLELNTKMVQLSSFTAGKEPNIIEYQLDVSPTLDRIYHQLSGHVLVRNEATKQTEWIEPEDDRLKILSEYGVKQIMNILSNYISPDTLLSNLSEEQVFWITKDFGVNLADLMYNRYELFYHHPSPEHLFEIYKPIFEANKFAFTEKQLYEKCVQWSREELQMKFRHFPMHVDMITHKVFINLTRAINGKERESLRKQYMISQNLGGQPMTPQQQKSGGMKLPWQS